LYLFERVDWFLTRSTGQGSSGIQDLSLVGERGAPICHQEKAEKAEKAAIRGRETKSKFEFGLDTSRAPNRSPDADGLFIQEEIIRDESVVVQSQSLPSLRSR